MAKGGNNQRSNGSRFMKPYDASNSFVKKVALRVSGYFGGLFGSSAKSDDSVPEYASFRGTDDTTITHSHYETPDTGKSVALTRCYDDVEVSDSPGKRLKIGTKRKYVPELPISPIASSSSLFQSSVSHNFDIQSSEDFITSAAGPSGLQSQKYAQTNSIATTSTNTNIKANGATDNHSDSSESTSGCSSLVPQSDRLSQSAFVSNSRKKILEEKLQYARQLKQTRASLYLNRSIPVVSDTTGSRRKPSFDVSVYGSPIFDKSSVREKMVSSPFYTGQTSYGGASAYRRPRTALCSQQSGRTTFERKDGLQIQVKPSHHGSTEDLSNMSHTAKRILEALEQFSTPISDAKRIPVHPGSPPLGRKRKRISDSQESTVSLSTTKAQPNQSKGPLISGLSIPTVPDLLKLKRLEKIQDSTAAARQVAVQKQEYFLPSDVAPSKHTGKIVTKSRDKEKKVTFEIPPEVNLPKIPLPISTLPKFDFKLTPMTVPTAADSTTNSKPVKSTIIDIAPNTKVLEPMKSFKFSPPISLPVPENMKTSSRKSNFTFSSPLNAHSKAEKPENPVLSNLSNFMSAEAMSKLKRKSVSDKSNSIFAVEPAKELKSGSVMDLLRKTLENNKKSENETKPEQSKSLDDTWECGSCLLRNLKDSKNCTGCKEPKLSVPSVEKTSAGANIQVSVSNADSKPVFFPSGFGNKFKPPSDSWSCKECFVNNNSIATKCIACETPKTQSNSVKEPVVSPVKTTPVAGIGFGDLFKKKAGQWECSVCLIQNKESDNKCAACETPKPGAEAVKSDPPKFSFGIPANARDFKFGIDKTDVKNDDKIMELPKAISPQANGPHAEPMTKPFGSVATSVGVFTFGIPPTITQSKSDSKSEVEPDSSKTVGSEKPKSFVFGELSKAEGAQATKDSTSEKFLESKDIQSKAADDSVDAKSTESPKLNFLTGNITGAIAITTAITSTTTTTTTTTSTSTTTTIVATATTSTSTSTTMSNNSNNNFTIKAFSPETQNKGTAKGAFSFGAGFQSQDNAAKHPVRTGTSTTTTNTVFGTGFKMPENVPSSTGGFVFGQSISAAPSVTMTSSSVETSKASPFLAFNILAKNGNAVSALSSPVADSSKTAEISESTLSSTTSLTTTTSSVFGSPIFKDSKVKLPFGSGITEFGGGLKTSIPSEMRNLSVVSSATTIFPTPTPIFSAASNIFNGPAVPAATNSFGSIPSSGAPFTNTAVQGFNSHNNNNNEQGFQPSGEPFPTSVPAFGSSNNQMPGFRLFGSPANTFGSTSSSGFGANTAPATPFGSSFGQSTSATEKPITPFVFGEKNTVVPGTTTPAVQTTAPNVFTFGATKQEVKPPQFSSGFGQSSDAFSFGSPNPPQGNLFGSFNQPKTASPFGGGNATFGNPTPNPFSQNSAPATFGGAQPKFEFGSQQNQSNPQPFQFGAANPQPQPNSAPGTTFNIAVPQTFNFTGGQAPPVFSATPAGPARRVLKATRRTQR